MQRKNCGITEYSLLLRLLHWMLRLLKGKNSKCSSRFYQECCVVQSWALHKKYVCEILFWELHYYTFHFVLLMSCVVSLLFLVFKKNEQWGFSLKPFLLLGCKLEGFEFKTTINPCFSCDVLFNVCTRSMCFLEHQSCGQGLTWRALAYVCLSCWKLFLSSLSCD